MRVSEAENTHSPQNCTPLLAAHTLGSRLNPHPLQ